MELILQEIERALDAKLYYLAVRMSLTLPDMCAALESSDGRATKQKYRDWYDSHLAVEFQFMSSADCYSLCCGIVHQGRFGIPNSQQFGRVLFTLPDGRGNTFHNNILNDALQFDSINFCHTIIQTVRSWFAAKKNDPTVQSNLPNLVQYRADGISPYMVGIPLIA